MVRDPYIYIEDAFTKLDEAFTAQVGTLKSDQAKRRVQDMEDYKALDGQNIVPLRYYTKAGVNLASTGTLFEMVILILSNLLLASAWLYVTEQDDAEKTKIEDSITFWKNRLVALYTEIAAYESSGKNANQVFKTQYSIHLHEPNGAKHIAVIEAVANQLPKENPLKGTFLRVVKSAKTANDGVIGSMKGRGEKDMIKDNKSFRYGSAREAYSMLGEFLRH